MNQPIRSRTPIAIMSCALLCGGVLAAALPTDAGAFVNTATQSGLMEVEAASLAQTASTDEAVRGFAARMIADHRKAQAELSNIAKSKHIPVPVKLDAEHMRILDSLRAQSGKSFDSAYAQHMVQDHAAVVELLQANVSNPDGELATFAGKTLVVVQEHKRLADNLLANMKR